MGEHDIHHLTVTRRLVFPLVAGSGKRLFAAEGSQVPLKLAASRAFDNGVLHLTYEPA